MLSMFTAQLKSLDSNTTLKGIFVIRWSTYNYGISPLNLCTPSRMGNMLNRKSVFSDLFTERRPYLFRISEVSVDDLRDMFNCIDPKISEPTCLKYMHLGIRDENQFNSKTKVGKELVLQNLRRSCVVRS